MGEGGARGVIWGALHTVHMYEASYIYAHAYMVVCQSVWICVCGWADVWMLYISHACSCPFPLKAKLRKGKMETNNMKLFSGFHPDVIKVTVIFQADAVPVWPRPSYQKVRV